MIAAVIGAKVPAGLALLLLSSIVPVSAATRVHVRVQGAESPPPEHSILVLVEASSATGETQARRFKAPGTASLQLDDALDWALEARAPGYWSRPQALVPGRGEITLTLYPAATLASTLSVADGEAMPPDVRLRLQSPEALDGLVVVDQGSSRDRAPGLDEATMICPVVGSQWSCIVPAGVWDVRVRAEGYVSKYLWGLELQAAETVDLKKLRLERGASVVGRVAVEEGALPGRISVQLAPAQAHAPETRQDLLDFRSLSLSEVANERGYFMLSGMEPGAYRIEASAEGFVSAILTPIPVYENAETEVTQALILRRPVEVDFIVSPPVDHGSRQWAAHLLRSLDMPGRFETTAEHVVEEDGTFTATDLTPGEYVIRLIDGDGQAFATEEVTVGHEGGILSVEVPIIEVEGTVYLGDDPLLAEVYFGGRRGQESVRMDSDEDGAFSGYLPREGIWAVEVVGADKAVSRLFRDVRVRVSKDGVAEVELTLPSTYLAGRVLDELGQPLPGARVLAVELALQSPLFQMADKDGEFLFMGMAEGLVSVEAEAAVGDERLATDKHIVTLVEDLDPGRQELIARPTLKLTGRVVSPDGHGIPGARILGEVTGTSGTSPRAVGTTTGVGGSYTLRVPSDAVAVDAWVFPIGCSLSYGRIEVDSEGGNEIVCSDDAGTLELEYPKDLSAEGTGGAIFILIDGVPLGMPLLQQWATLNGQSSSTENGRLVLPQMPAGNYSLCLMTPRESAQYMSVGELSGAGCSEGFLRRSGSLSLVIEPAESS